MQDNKPVETEIITADSWEDSFKINGKRQTKETELHLAKLKEYLALLENKKILKITKRDSVASGKFYLVVTLKQFTDVLTDEFEECKKESDSWFEYTKKNIVYDGLVFSVTKAKLDKAVEDKTLESMFDYLCSRLYFPSDRLKIEECKDEEEIKYASSYIDFKRK